MKRRPFLVGLTGFPVAAHAQAVGTKVVGFLHSGAPSYMPAIMDRLRNALAEHGFVDGKNLRFEVRMASGAYERIPALAKELLALKVDVALTAGGSEPISAFKTLAPAMPLVFTSAIDPVKAGLVASLGRPGGNITGVSLVGASLEPKRLEALAQLVPGAAPLCALVNPKYPAVDQQIESLRSAAAALRRPLGFVRASSAAEIDVAIKNAAAQGYAGMVQTQDPFFSGNVPLMVAATVREKLPAIYQGREFVDLGGLASYGTNFIAAYADAGGYLARILNGAKPADLPVLQPTKFEFVVNLKAARAIGLDVPTSILSTADEVIE